MFTALNLPKASLELFRSGGTVYVWDVFRNKKIKLTPEEWVRQHFLHFLVSEKQVPLGLIASEFNIEVNKLKRRCDGVIFNRESKPVAIIECKAPEIGLSEKTLHQIAQYNFKLRVDWLILTNGMETVVAKIDHENKSVNYRREVPDFYELTG
ncbi:MAG: type I restriction enzyme HsdR N-terminal domain-containing protein [Brumimicrobium sp.]|nr:type I restriction enzyme HsdR N-terminal domain-containing protein [Brumimicrobium sp.]